MDNNVIHSRRHGDGVSVYADSIDRGPRGYQGIQGVPGEQGEQGVGVGSMKVNSKEHLITTLTDGTKLDAGELPKIQAAVAATITLDGASKAYEFTGAKADNVSYITINGVEYTSEDYTIDDVAHTLTLNLDEVPSGELKVIARSHGLGSNGVLSVNGMTGEVEIPEVEALTASEIDNIIAEAEDD